MTKVLAFIFVLSLVQSFPIAAISGESSTTGNAIACGPDDDQGPTMGPGICGDRAELEIAKENYLGKSGTVCKRHPGTNCYEGGECCKGRGKCKLLYKKIKSMSSVISRWTLVNFCLDGQ